MITRYSNRNRGMTLIELMVAIAILGILVAIAVPGYQRYIEGARQTDAQAALMSLANAMERFHTQNYSYVGTADSNNKPTMFPSETPLDGNAKFYDLRIDQVTANAYRLNAIPKGAQAGAPTLRLLSTGERINWD